MHDILPLLLVDTVRIVDEAVGVGKRHDLGTELGRLLAGVLGHVAGARNEHGLAFEGFAAGGEHLLGEIAGAETGGLRAQQAAAPAQAFAGKGAGKFIAQALVLAEEVADLTSADTDVAGRHVRVLADMTAQFRHEALAETHHLRVGLAARAEIGTALATAHGQRREAVLERLLEGEELQDAEVHAGVEADAALVRADRAVHLDPVTFVDLDVAGIVHPRNAEHDHALGFDHPLEDLLVHEVRVGDDIGRHVVNHLADGLVELDLARVPGDKPCHEGLDIVLGKFVHNAEYLLSKFFYITVLRILSACSCR